jgi:hypothetical protein
MIRRAVRTKTGCERQHLPGTLALAAAVANVSMRHSDRLRSATVRARRVTAKPLPPVIS